MELMSLSQSVAYNSFFIYACSIYLIDKGDIQEAIEVIENHKHLLEDLTLYPSIQFFIFSQLAEAYLKKGSILEAQKIIKLSRKHGEEFYGTKENLFFANITLLEGACLIGGSEPSREAELLIKKAMSIYEKIFEGEDKHRNQAFGHLILGKFYALRQDYSQAKEHYMISEKIFDNALKNKKIDDVSEVYKLLAILGADSRDEGLTHTYFKKQLELFGLEHPKTQEIILYLDKNGLSLPL